MIKIFWGLALLVLVGCSWQITRSPLHHVTGENIFARELYIADYITFSEVYYHMSTSTLENLEELRADTLQRCQNAWKDRTFLGFANLDQGCSVSEEGDEKIYNSKKYKDLKARIESEKIRKEEVIKQAKKDEELKIKKEKIAKVESVYSGKCKKFKLGSSEYENCLFAAEKEVINKQKELDSKLAKMTPIERRDYNCENAFKFRKGSDKFRDCVFKLYTTELELEKLELQKQVALANERVAKAQAEAAQSAQARAEAVAAAQIAAAEAQKSAARSQSLASSLSLMQLGSSMMSSPAPAPSSPGMDRMRTTCRNVGGFINCY